MIAKQLIDVATVDLSGFFLQTNRKGNDITTLRLTRALVLLLVCNDSKRWHKHLRSENDTCVLCVVCDKSIYVTLNAALLICKKLARGFGEWKLIMNQCNPCVCNRLVRNKQLTIMFHADDLMMAHANPSIATDSVHGNEHPLSITRVKLHKHLRTTIDFGLKRRVAISQYDFIENTWASLREGLKEQCRSTLAPEFLFKVDKNEEMLDDCRKE